MEDSFLNKCKNSDMSPSWTVRAQLILKHALLTSKYLDGHHQFESASNTNELEAIKLKGLSIVAYQGHIFKRIVTGSQQFAPVATFA